MKFYGHRFVTGCRGVENAARHRRRDPMRDRGVLNPRRKSFVMTPADPVP